VDTDNIHQHILTASFILVLLVGG